LGELNIKEVFERIRTLSEELEEELCHFLVGENKDSLPIFDYEI
jgi:hypothetical protein